MMYYQEEGVPTSLKTLGISASFNVMTISSAGFTFSFPMKQHSISSGELITWTKSFNCSGLEGVDVAALLERCLHARGLHVTVRVLLNDTTGTLVAGAHMHDNVGVCSTHLLVPSQLCNGTTTFLWQEK